MNRTLLTILFLIVVGLLSAIYAQLFLPEIGFVVATTLTFALVISSLVVPILLGTQLLKRSTIKSLLILTVLSSFTGIAFAAAPAAQGKVLYLTSGIAFVSALAVFVITTLLWLIMIGLRKVFRRKSAI